VAIASAGVFVLGGWAIRRRAEPTLRPFGRREGVATGTPAIERGVGADRVFGAAAARPAGPPSAGALAHPLPGSSTWAFGGNTHVSHPEATMEILPERHPSDVAPGPCPACGAPLGGRAGCQMTFDALSAASWGSPTRGAVHNLLVDAYCMQHPEDYCRSAKSYAAHLAGLCCGVEAGSDPRRHRAVARWLDGARELAKPAVPGARGTMTVADAAWATEEEVYAAHVRAWAGAVWAAYGSQHELARTWLRAAVTAAGIGRERTRRREAADPVHRRPTKR
jgi:hypothetical protein